MALPQPPGSYAYVNIVEIYIGSYFVLLCI